MGLVRFAITYISETKGEKNMAVVKISKDNFESEVMNAEKPVLIDFWAEWCGPCKMMGPVIDEVEQMQSEVIVGKINVDEQPELAMKYNVMSIPTLILFKNGEVAEKSVGFISKDEVLAFIKR